MKKKLLHATRNAFVALGCLACSSAALAANMDVTTTSDAIANDGFCSLREAIINANTDSRLFAAAGECPAGSGVDKIFLLEGTYTLAIPPAGTNDATTGSLNITASVDIVGIGNPILQGGTGWADRVFEISFGTTVNMSSFTISGGNANVTVGGVDGGGAIRTGGTLTLNYMTVSGNTATTSGSTSAAGGGLFVLAGGSLTLTNSTIAANHAQFGAGIVTYGSLTMTGSTVSGNQGTKANGGAAGIYAVDALVNITNSTISGNFVIGQGNGYGSGITLDAFSQSNPHGVVNLNNVTIANNSAGSGGGIYVSAGTVNLSNTIIAGNSGGGTPNCRGAGVFSINSNGNNLIGDNTGCTISGVKASDKIGTAASPINPLLGALGNDGGPTQTMPLQIGSPAIDSGNNATCAVTDQRGTTRPQGSACDIGAFELGVDSGRTVVEFFNTTLGHYFITASAAEQASIDAGGSGPGWTRTGNNFKTGGLSGVCRFYGTPGVGPNSHFYTVDAAECAQVMLDPGWRFESYDFNTTPPVTGTCATGTVPVYRAYNNRFAQNDSNHRYSTDIGIYNGQISLGWKGEGVVFCAPA